MKSFILSASVLAAIVGMTSCEKHEWEDEDGKGVVELYKTNDSKKDHGDEEHKSHGGKPESHDKKEH